ncbi:hypothetical protein GCM10027290_61630 [Micromonospora sonneratiae]
MRERGKHGGLAHAGVADEDSAASALPVRQSLLDELLATGHVASGHDVYILKEINSNWINISAVCYGESNGKWPGVCRRGNPPPSVAGGSHLSVVGEPTPGHLGYLTPG